jgi:hypothetical protein
MKKQSILIAIGLFAVTTFAQRTIPRDPRYPAHWWTPVSEVGTYYEIWMQIRKQLSDMN